MRPGSPLRAGAGAECSTPEQRSLLVPQTLCAPLGWGAPSFACARRSRSMRPAQGQRLFSTVCYPAPGFTPFSTQPSARGHHFNHLLLTRHPFWPLFPPSLSPRGAPGSPHQETAQSGPSAGVCPPSPSFPLSEQNQTLQILSPFPSLPPSHLELLPLSRLASEGSREAVVYKPLLPGPLLLYYFLISQDF